jgi:Ca-activated chloride channel family protein
MRQRVIALLVLVGLAGSAAPQISVNVDLVVLNPVVRDRKGQFASDLHESDFQVYEDGVRQTIQLFRHEDIPVTVGLVVDHSGSMRPKLTDVITAVRTFVQSSRPDDQMFVVNFNEKVTLGLPDAIQSGNRSDALARAISGTPAIGKTALYDAATEAFRQLRAGGPAKKVLIVISDGGDNASSHKLAEVLKTAEESSVLVYTIGIFDDEDEDKNPGVLTRLAKATGGEAFFPRERSEVVAICESIARDIRNQYTVGYVSSNSARTGAWRSIRLTAAAAGHDKLEVRTRSGYIAESR